MPPQRVTLPEMSIHRWQKLLSFIIGVMASGAHSLPNPRPLACHSSSSNSSNEPPCNALICLPRCYDLFAAPANNTNVTIEMTRYENTYANSIIQRLTKFLPCQDGSSESWWLWRGIDGRRDFSVRMERRQDDCPTRGFRHTTAANSRPGYLG